MSAIYRDASTLPRLRQEMMNKRIQTSLVAGLIALLLPLGSCRDSVPTGGESDESRVSMSLSGSTTTSRVVPASGESFFLKINAPAQWTIALSPTSASEWLVINQTSGAQAHDLGIRVAIGANAGAQREAFLTLTSAGQTASVRLIQQASASYTPGAGEDPIAPGGQPIFGEPTRLEIPKLAGGSHNYFVTHKTGDGLVNFSLEYDVQRRHPRWVAFVFDEATGARHYTTRTDAWAWDPIIPSIYSTETWFSGSGYSRGHMVASSDRYYSRQANEQTFYYSNMSPQLQDHNGGIWNELELKVQAWGRSSAFRDILYVAKGGTIRDDQVQATRLRGTMVIPKYYYMALVVRKGDSYHGLAFWTEHRKYTKTSLRSLTLSIDELEERTGIDFFHNLPDEVEAQVERETASSHSWPGI